MKIEFTLTANDFFRLQKVINRRLKNKAGLFSSSRLFYVVAGGAIGFATGVFSRVVRDNPEISQPLTYTGYLLIAALLASILAPYAHLIFIRKHLLSTDGPFLSAQTVELTSEALVIKSKAGKAQIPWSSILALEQDDKNHYLFIDATQAIVLPKATLAKFSREFEQLLVKTRC